MIIMISKVKYHYAQNINLFPEENLLISPSQRNINNLNLIIEREHIDTRTELLTLIIT